MIGPKCPFTAISANFGPHAVTRQHLDLLNSIFGICLLLVFGKFDAKLSANLALYDAKVLCHVPHGAFVYLPSAATRHGNTAIDLGEERWVLTLFLPGEADRLHMPLF